MFKFIKRIFIWWEVSTLGTQWHTFLHGEKVGSDDEGNLYYRGKKKAPLSAGMPERRWVVYNGAIDATRIPAEWHAWLHHTSDLPPSEAPLPAKAFETAHETNKTGSKEAYFPAGSPMAGGKRASATGDYEAWRP